MEESGGREGEWRRVEGGEGRCKMKTIFLHRTCHNIRLPV